MGLWCRDDNTSQTPKKKTRLLQQQTNTKKFNNMINANNAFYYAYQSTGLVKTAVGIAAGGLIGMIMFRGGKGNRAASIAAGVGAAAGSTYERFIASSSTTTTTTSAT